MTTCLLCPSKAVSDGLCVADGARLWAARMWCDDYEMALRVSSQMRLIRTLSDPSPRATAFADVPNCIAARAFLSRLDAARAERKRAEDERIRRRDGAT